MSLLRAIRFNGTGSTKEYRLARCGDEFNLQRLPALPV
jgi:hypothetical protein